MIADRYKYIRDRFGVPIEHLVRVAADGKVGVVHDVWGVQVMVMMEGECWARLYDPMDLEYIQGEVVCGV